jgi:hypothetical protein
MLSQSGGVINNLPVHKIILGLVCGGWEIMSLGCVYWLHWKLANVMFKRKFPFASCSVESRRALLANCMRKKICRCQEIMDIKKSTVKQNA